MQCDLVQPMLLQFVAAVPQFEATWTLIADGVPSYIRLRDYVDGLVSDRVGGCVPTLSQGDLDPDMAVG